MIEMSVSRFLIGQKPQIYLTYPLQTSNHNPTTFLPLDIFVASVYFVTHWDIQWHQVGIIHNKYPQEELSANLSTS